MCSISNNWEKYFFANETVQLGSSVLSDSLRPHGLQHARLACLSEILRAYSNSCPSSRWCYPTISSSVVPFPEAGSFPVSQFFATGDQSWSFTFSISPSNEYPGLISIKIGLISLQSKRLSRVFSNTIVQKHQFFGTQLSL